MTSPGVYGGFAPVKVGAITHSYIKREAHARGMSIHEFILESAQAYTGKRIESLELIPESPHVTLENRINAYMERYTGVLAPGGEWYEAIRQLRDEVRALRTGSQLKLEGDMV